MSTLPSGVPTLDALSGEWLSASDLEHLHSLRNQWGQAHVNADLTSISWLAMAPFAGGYRSGVLRVNGTIPAADSFSWTPWGVRRRATESGLAIETDTRLGFERSTVLWHTAVTNTTSTDLPVDLELELLAPIAHSETDWGWLHGTPWNNGHRHDFYTTERIRAAAPRPSAAHVQVLAEDARHVRLGRPRIPGIQRDEDDAPMLLETSLPAHISLDSPSRHRAPALPATFSEITTTSGIGELASFPGPWRIDDTEAELRLDAVALGDGSEIGFTVRVETTEDGVLLTHGNHPDSLQFAVLDGMLVASIGGELLRSDRTLDPGTAHRVSATVSSAGVTLVLDGARVATSGAWWLGERWSTALGDGIVAGSDSASPARTAFAFSAQPTIETPDGAPPHARWSRVLRPGETLEVGVVLEIGTDPITVGDGARAVARDFDREFAAVASSWRSLWAHAFTPGNPDHSGYLPVFESDSDGLGLGYYYGVLLALYLRTTQVSTIGPVFLTGGPRLGATTTFYWDQSEWARVGAMLEPRGIRAWIVAALGQPYDSSHSFDTRSLTPVGNHYAANDHALFRIVEHYVGVTGDHSVLDEIAAGRSVLDLLRECAYRPREHGGAETLVDLGRDAWELLECVPNYRDSVVSFNAGYVGMLDSLASLLDTLGEREEAAAARDDAELLAVAVLAQYAGDGRWMIRHPEGDEAIGHCLDFELVAAHLGERLSETQRSELVAFVTSRLLAGDWMLALDPNDPIAPFSDRPDHGAAGAFAGWPGSTAYGLARLGRSDVAADFLSRIHRSRSGALWGQAVEAVGDGRFRVAERGVSNRDSSAAVAVTEAVLGGLFGIDAGFARSGSGTLESPHGTLRNVRAVGFDLPQVSTASVLGR